MEIFHCATFPRRDPGGGRGEGGKGGLTSPIFGGRRQRNGFQFGRVDLLRETERKRAEMALAWEEERGEGKHGIHHAARIKSGRVAGSIRNNGDVCLFSVI